MVIYVWSINVHDEIESRNTINATGSGSSQIFRFRCLVNCEGILDGRLLFNFGSSDRTRCSSGSSTIGENEEGRENL